MRMKYLQFSLIFLVGLSVAAHAADNQTSTEAPRQTTNPTPKPDLTTPKPEVTTTLTPEELCAQYNNASCGDCLKVAGAKCLWCSSDSSCRLYPYSKVLPSKDICALDKARWGVCWLNFEALIIGLSVTGGVIILAIVVCCCCCCCRNNNKRKYDKDDARYNAQKMERKAKSDERRAERKERLDEIRRKYGLMKDEPYQRFDA